jgi:IS30 family transposase
MKYRKRIYYTEKQKALMWDRWQAGDSLHEIARLFDRHHSSVRGIFERSGGMRPRARRRSARSLFIQARGALKKELLAHLRQTRAMRRPRGHTQKNRQIKQAVSIRECPAEVEDRAVPGHWEGDLLMGTQDSQIATLVERQTRYCMLVRVKSKDTKTVANALIRQAHKLPRELYKSLTWDRGKEMADHKRFSLATKVNVYFCDPQSPWQRGSNEQINGLLRQYFPKGMDLSNIHQNHLNAIARRLNERPRKTLGYYSPAEKFAQCVASIS